MSSESLSKNKESMRRFLKKEIAAISDEDKKSKSAKVAKDLFEIILGKSTQSIKIPENCLIGGFAPLNDEPVWSEDFLSYSGRLCFPKFVSAGLMAFYKCDYDQMIESNEFGQKILVPNIEGKIVVPKVLIIPGLGFNKSGERLGRGKGFYDRYLENFSGLRIGVCYSAQLREDLPTDPHDVAMDYVVSDMGIISKV
jgi:5-formyltetrahydrofolate cyclo-ligase